MADTNHPRTVPPVEGDGISYSGIVWFLVVLAATVIVCEVFVWGMVRFVFLPHRTMPAQVTTPLAPPVVNPSIEQGHVATGLVTPPVPGLLVEEPKVLKAFRDGEDKELAEYGWINQGAGTVRLPIARAKELLLERGLPIRPAAAPAAEAAPAGK
jgi:hypothetical protein